MIIAVAGTGYVGLSISVLLSQENKVIAVDLLADKVEKINNKKSPIADNEIEKYLAQKDLNLTATTDSESAYKQADFVVVATPTNYDTEKNYFDTESVESVIQLVTEINPNAVIATDVGAIPEIIQDGCGIVINAKESGQLKDALISLMSDEKAIATLSNNAYNRVKEKYGIEAVIKKHKEVWFG